MIWFLVGLIIALVFGKVVISVIGFVLKLIWWPISCILQILFGNQDE